MRRTTYDKSGHHSKGVVSALMMPVAIIIIFAGLAFALKQKPSLNISNDKSRSFISQIQNAISDRYGPAKTDKQSADATPNSSAEIKSGLPASHPDKIKISSINVDAPIVNLGLNKDGTVQVPSSPWSVGWYSKSVSPGQIGPAVMIGHLDSATGPAVFWNLKKLQPGDRIEIARADGSVAVFQVESSESVPQNSFPTQKVYGGTNKPSLRLITCAGTWLSKQGHYSNNLVIYASLVDQYAAR